MLCKCPERLELQIGLVRCGSSGLMRRCVARDVTDAPAKKSTGAWSRNFMLSSLDDACRNSYPVSFHAHAHHIDADVYFTYAVDFHTLQVFFQQAHQ